jgi:hypothetical protein
MRNEFVIVKEKIGNLWGNESKASVGGGKDCKVTSLIIQGVQKPDSLEGRE